MKRNFFVVGIISMALIIGCFLTSCEEPKIECGSLTITNIRNGFNVLIYLDTDINSAIDLHNWTLGGISGDNCVAYSATIDSKYVHTPDTSSPYSLTESKRVDRGFLRSGTYLVVVYDDLRPKAFMVGVVFKNGNATIDFKDMTLLY